MSDRIKKIKVKKSDGTFSDYIPIGADAKNIDTIDGESVELKLNKKPYYYNNVADMKADTKLKIGDMAITLGYYEANDGGNGTYKIVNDDNLIDNGGSIHNLNNGLKAKLIIENKINIKQFGAKGDGISDDTIKIQNAIDFGFSKGIDVYVPATDDYFLTTLPLILVAYNSKHPISYWDGNGCKLIGESKSKSRIVKIGHESLQDKNSTLLCFTSENEKSTGIIIDNLSIEHYDDTNLNKTIGNCIDINISRSQLSNLNIIGFNGINAKIFSSTFENIVFNCVEDALISKGGTSNLYRFLYAPQCKNAYTISSQYSSLINVCGDNCKGTLFKLGGMGLSLINCGCESPELENIFDIITDYTTLNIDNFCSVRQTGIENELNLEDCSVVKISSPIHVSIAINIDSFSIIENKLINGTSYFFNPLYTDSPYNHKIYTLIKNLRYYKNFSGGTNEKIKL